MDKERRISESIEVRELDDGTEVIEGLAIVFNSESNDLGGFIETIKPGAVRGADRSDVVALFNHDTNIVLGRTDKTLKLTVTKEGLRYRITPPKTQAAQDLLTSIKRGDVRGSSFGFTIARGGDVWEEPKEDGEPWVRTITQFDKIFDVSPVVYPAYSETDTSVAKRELGVLKDKIERDETDKLELEKQKQKLEADKIVESMNERLNGCKIEEE